MGLWDPAINAIDSQCELYFKGSHRWCDQYNRSGCGVAGLSAGVINAGQCLGSPNTQEVKTESLLKRHDKAMCSFQQRCLSQIPKK